MVRIAEGFPPDNPNETRMGWTTALETDKAYYDVHPGRSLIGMGVVSLTATLIALGAQQSPEGLGFSWTQTYSSTDVSEHVTQTGPQHDITRKTVGTPGTAPETTQRMMSATALMPDVPSFDLSRTPEAQRLMNGEQFSEFLSEARQMVAGGWTLSGYHVEGMSSDETQLNAEAGLGTPDPQNEALAREYGQFVADVFEKQLAASGLPIPEGTGSFASHEEVLNGDQRASIEQIRQENGFATDEELIAAYKADPDKFSDYDRYTIRSMFDDSRGATVQMVFSKTTPGTPGTSETTITDHCVITRHVIDQTHTTKWQDTELLPIVVLPFIWARRRRKEEEIPEEPVAEEPEAEPEVTRSFRLIFGEDGEIEQVVEDDSMGRLYPFPFRFAPDENAEAAQPAPAEEPITAIPEAEPADEEIRLPGYYGVSENRRGGIRIRRRGLDSIKRDIDMSRWHPEADRREYYGARVRRLADKLGYDGDLGELEQYVDRELIRRERMQRRRRIGLGIAGGILALAASTARLDAGYCPDPQDHAKQSFRWNDFPDSMYLSFHLWGTDINSRQFELWQSGCETPKATPPVHPTPAPAPTCDVRTVHEVNGQVVSTTETHYPGATMVTKETP